MNDVAYTTEKDGSVVVIHDGINPDMRLNKESLLLALATIRRNRADYANEAAWRRHLVIYEGACILGG